MSRVAWRASETPALLKAVPAADLRLAATSPVILALGLTSFLTDIASEMVNSLLPVYLFLHLTPFQYGAIDGVYNGLSIALVGLAAGILADRWSRKKRQHRLVDQR